MIKKIKELFGWFKYNEKLHRENNQLIDKLNSFDSKCLLEKILCRPLNWVDTSNFSENEQRIWHGEAQALLRNPVFVSLCGDSKSNGEIVKDLIEYIAKNSKNFEEVLYLRAKIAGVELIKNLVSTIPSPDSSPRKETGDPFSTI